MRRTQRPFEYIVYTNMPAYGGPYRGCRVGTKRIPRGMDFDDLRDTLPPTVGRLTVVSAHSADAARKYAAKYRSVTCRKK